MSWLSCVDLRIFPRSTTPRLSSSNANTSDISPT